jgi:hypothetical protein
LTTFVTRQTARDALAALFVADGSWQAVYGYMPNDEELDGQSPVLTVRSGGTAQEMASLHVNPTSYRYLLRTMVLANDADSSWSESNAEDKLDELDQKLRQVIRDNVGGVAGSNFLRFDPGASTTGYSIIDGELYRWEERTIWADFSVGA